MRVNQTILIMVICYILVACKTKSVTVSEGNVGQFRGQQMYVQYSDTIFTLEPRVSNNNNARPPQSAPDNVPGQPSQQTRMVPIAVRHTHIDMQDTTTATATHWEATRKLNYTPVVDRDTPAENLIFIILILFLVIGLFRYVLARL